MTALALLRCSDDIGERDDDDDYYRCSENEESSRLPPPQESDEEDEDEEVSWWQQRRVATSIISSTTKNPSLLTHNHHHPHHHHNPKTPPYNHHHNHTSSSSPHPHSNNSHHHYYHNHNHRFAFPQILSVLLLVLPRPSTPFILEGSDTSYARFSRWNVNTTLSFEFTTNQPDGLILYTDDGGKTDFFELKLVEGILRLRFNLLNQGTQLINIGNHLNNGLWHRVELAVTFWNVLVTVDGFVSERRNLGTSGSGGVGASGPGGSGGSPHGGYYDRGSSGGGVAGGGVGGGMGGSAASASLLVFDNTGVFIGGLPGYFNSRLSELTLPSVVFEPRFRGAVRNLVYGAIGGSGAVGVVKPQEIVESKGLISGSGTSEACERHDPCLHGGFCISTDSGPVCDCKHIDFEGVNCEVEKSPTAATFHGNQFIGYDFRASGGHQPIISQLDEISLYFKTSTRNRNLLLHTLLFYSGDGVDYIALTIRSGQLMLSINLGSGPLDTKLHPDHLRFDDGQWHSVRVHRKIQEISRTTNLCHITASVDGIHFDRWTLSGSFTLLSSNRVTVAGYDTLRPLNGIRGVTNFIGCLKKVEYRADTLRLNILDLAVSGNRLITISGGRLAFVCQQEIDAFETGMSGTSLGGFTVDEHHGPPHHYGGGGGGGGLHSGIGYPGGGGGGGGGGSSSSHHHVMPPPLPPSTDNPITFTTPYSSYLVIPPYQNVSSHSTSIQLKLRTTEPNGVVLYSSSIPSNLVAIELAEGHVIVHLQASPSTPPTRIQATSSRIHDGEWHTIKLLRNGRSGSVSVDDLTTDFNLKSEARSIYLGVLYLGNVPSTISDDRVWSVGLGLGFVGCLKNVYVEHTLVDLVRLANSQDIGGIRPYCQVGSAGECVSNPCLNNGKCTDGWGRFVCECGFVGFEGGVCQVDAPYLDLSDASVFEFTNRSVSPGSPLETRLFSPTQAQDIRFRFKGLNANSVLLSVSGLDSDFIEVRIAGGSGSNAGRLRVRVRLKDTEKIFTVGHPGSSSSPFNDNNWHVFQMSRRGADIHVFVDDLPPVSGTLATRSPPTMTPVKYTISSLTSSFTGSFQSLTVNGLELLSAIRLKRLKPTGVSQSPSIRTFKSINNPIQFLPRSKSSKAPPSYVRLPQLKAYSNVRIRFKFKTQSANGVLFYNGASSSSDYVCVQVEDFKVVFSMGFGDAADNPAVEIISHRLKLDSWVDVDIWWDGSSYVVMGVDQYVYEEEIRGWGAGAGGIHDNLVLKLNGVLYVGGGVGDVFHSRVRGLSSIAGGGGGDRSYAFVGCMANVDLGGDGVTFEGAGGGGGGGIVHGCGAGGDGGLEPYNPLSSRCTTDVCLNGGRCVEDSGSSVSCDCEMTSYTGPTCSLESSTYEFSSSSTPQGAPLYRSHSRPGVIQFTYQQNREPTTLHDNIAFGFATSSNDAVILRIESVKTTDYLEIEMIAGKVRVTYNMYLNKDHTIGDVNHPVNDNAYHVLRFTREGPNATLQLDNADILTTYPINFKENLFNSIGVITVGGRVKELKREITIVRGFKGIVSGLVINGLHILDMTTNGDPRVKIYGDVRKVRGVMGGGNSVYGVSGGSLSTGTSQQPAPSSSHVSRNKHRNNNPSPEYVYNTGDFQRAAPASSSSTTSSDDLISSGDSHSHQRCMVTDDEDNEDCAGGLPSGAATDDIITPVYVPTTRITTTITTTKSNQDSNMYFPCAEDDEDCVDVGSGGGGEDHQQRPSSRDRSHPSSTTTSSSSSSASSSAESDIITSTTDTSSQHQHPYHHFGGSSTTDSRGGSDHHDYTSTSSSSGSSSSTTHTDRQSSSSSSSSGTATTTSTTTTTTSTTRFTPPHPGTLPPYHRGGPLFDFEHNKPTPSSTSTIPSIEKKKKSYNETVYFADSGDSTLIIIIIIAVLMIIIVSILIIFFMCKRRDDPIYKIEQQQQALHHAQQQQQQQAAAAAAAQQQQQQFHGGGGGVQQVAGGPTGAMMMRGVPGGGQPGQQQPQGAGGPGGPRKTGVKEWYV